MSVKTLMKLEQFFELPDFDDKTGETYELDHGELIVMPPQRAKHERVKNRIARILIVHLERNKVGGEVHVETGFVLDNESWRRPDVSFVSAGKAATIDDEPFRVAPDLAVEVHSPSDSKRFLARKVRHFLESGTNTVWVVYPDTKEVNVVQQSRDEWFGVEDKITLNLLPGFETDVRRFFED